MNIERYYQDRFFGEVRGIKIDNSYDLYTLNKYKKIIKEDNVDFIFSQDYDLSYLINFPNIKYLSLSEVEDIKHIYYLKNLIGLRINSKYLNELDLSYFENLKFIDIIEDEYNRIRNYDKLRNIENICLEQCDISNFKIINGFEVKNLQIIFCNKINSLKGLETLKNIECLHLDYCSKLVDIEHLKFTKMSLKSLSIIDCPKIQNIDFIFELNNLESLYLMNDEFRGGIQLKSLAFINNMKNLKKFKTSYKIIDGDLKPLLRLKDVSILRFFKNYNLSDKELPHEYVIFDDGKSQKLIKVDLIDQGINNPNIIWLK